MQLEIPYAETASRQVREHVEQDRIRIGFLQPLRVFNDIFVVLSAL